MPKSPHKFRVGDVVVRIDGKDGKFVVSGIKGWIHSTFEGKDGLKDAWISLSKEIGSISLLTHASEYKIFMRREHTPKKWWTIFPRGEK